MGNKTNITLDLNSLIEIATGDGNAQSIKITDDILTFAIDFNIKAGKFKIKNDILYSIYKNWSKKAKPREKFSKALGRLVEIDNKGNSFISVSAIKLHQDLYEFLNKKSRPKEKVRSYKSHFESFLKYYGFESGDFFIKESSIYYLYDKWTYKNKNKSSLKEQTLLKFCSMYLPVKTIKVNKCEIRYLGINRNKMTTTLEQLEFAAKWNEIRNGKKEKRKSPKSN